MKEEILHHIWLHKKINATRLSTTSGESLQILNFGQYLQNAGPDFFNAQLIIGSQKWAGNIEIHVKSSDWYLHNHQNDRNFDNVILHVVWEHDVDIYTSDTSVIPVLELKNFIDKNLLDKYASLIQTKSWINCENTISTIDSFYLEKWKERLYFEKLETKVELIESLLKVSNNDWEQVFFILLAKNFGLNTNGIVFLEMAKTIPFAVIRKEKINLEAIFFGVLNMLDEDFEDNYCKQLKKEWNYLKIKYQLNSLTSHKVQFFKLRPDNFPTIRLSQFANLLLQNDNFFSKIVECKSIQDYYALFKIQPSSYWLTHFNFDKVSNKSNKFTSKSFIDLLILNTILPIKFAFEKHTSQLNLDEIIAVLNQIKPEKNSIVEKFDVLGVKSKSAFDSQSLLYLKQNYCDNQKCLQCQIGISLLK